LKVLLIYPPISKRERYSSDIGYAGGNQIPLGIYYIAAHIRNYGHEVDVVDAEVNNLTSDDIIYKIVAFKPELIGISSTTPAFHRAVEVALHIKRKFPEIPITLGGPHVSSSVDHAMLQSCFDFGVLKEGEATFLELIETIQTRGDFGKVLGLVYRENKKIVQNPLRPPIEDLDSLPFPAYDLIQDIYKYSPPPCNYKKLPVVNIMTSRGCPNKCTFCDQSIFGRRLRSRSAENVAAEIEMLYSQYGVREIAFVDDTFTLRPKRNRELFRILDEKKISIPWTCMVVLT